MRRLALAQNALASDQGRYGIEQEGGFRAWDTADVAEEAGRWRPVLLPFLHRDQSPFHVAFVDARLPTAVNPYGVNSMQIQKNSIFVLGGGHSVPADFSK